VAGSHKVNGVAALHTQLMKSSIFSDFNQFSPGKIVNKTNGISFRRWLQRANPTLTRLLVGTIGERLLDDPEAMQALEGKADNKTFQRKFAAARQHNKQELARCVWDQVGVRINTAALFDVQIKRIHEYKRQLLNVLHVVTLYNRIRATLRALYELRAESPQLLSASENWLLTRLGSLIAPEEYLQLLEQALGEVKTRTARPKDRVRVVLEGSFCEQPPIGLIECLEEAGCYILDDDFLLGSHWFTGDIPIESNPLHALAESYSNRSVFSGVKHDLREAKADHLIRNAREKKADAVIFMAPKFCEPALFDYALYRRAFDKHNIPNLFLEYEEKAWSFDRARSEVETFVESLLFD